MWLCFNLLFPRRIYPPKVKDCMSIRASFPLYCCAGTSKEQKQDCLSAHSLYLLEMLLLWKSTPQTCSCDNDVNLSCNWILNYRCGALISDFIKLIKQNLCSDLTRKTFLITKCTAAGILPLRPT